MIHLVWLKKDFRLSDHAPLVQAAALGKVFFLWLQEPKLWAQPDVSERHIQLETLCVQGLAADIQDLGGAVFTAKLDTPEAFAKLKEWAAPHGGFTIYSHEETGNWASFQRDLALKAWCKKEGVAWHEAPRNAVVRCLYKKGGRNSWGKHWQERIEQAPLSIPDIDFFKATLPTDFFEVQALAAAEQTQLYLRHTAQGTQARLTYFLENELSHYRRGMSSPVTAPVHCSRLSTQLAMGVVSIRELIFAIRQRYNLLKLENLRNGELAGLHAFEGRLHWHCHFIQKLEDEPQLEFRNIHSGYNGIREKEFNSAYFEAWASGNTGVPMVDACMRRLNATGWINFRMRAMLMSFAAYHLWLDWREPALHLARQFSDYEPGIHYPQIQMQSGTTGINAARIYNPVKQALDQDASGEFIRKWCPELGRVPLEYLAQPWLMTENLQVQYGCVLGKDYPAPIVDVEIAARAAKERYHAWRKQSGIYEAAKAVMEKHGSRKGAPKRARTAKSKAKVKAAVIAAEPIHASLF